MFRAWGLGFGLAFWVLGCAQGFGFFSQGLGFLDLA